MTASSGSVTNGLYAESTSVTKRCIVTVIKNMSQFRLTLVLEISMCILYSD